MTKGSEEVVVVVDRIIIASQPYRVTRTWPARDLVKVKLNYCKYGTRPEDVACAPPDLSYSMA